MTATARTAYISILDEIDRASEKLQKLDYQEVLNELEAEIKSRQDCVREETE